MIAAKKRDRLSTRKQLPLHFSTAVFYFVVTSAFLAGCDRGSNTNDGGAVATVAEQTPSQKHSDEAVASRPKLSAEAQRLRRVLKDGKVGSRWYYDDLGGAMAEAKATGKPLFVAFR